MKFRVSRGPGGVPRSIIAVFGGGTGGLDPLNARALTWRRVTPGGRATDRGHGVPRGHGSGEDEVDLVSRARELKSRPRSPLLDRSTMSSKLKGDS